MNQYYFGWIKKNASLGSTTTYPNPPHITVQHFRTPPIFLQGGEKKWKCRRASLQSSTSDVASQANLSTCDDRSRRRERETETRWHIYDWRERWYQQQQQQQQPHQNRQCQCQKGNFFLRLWPGVIRDKVLFWQSDFLRKARGCCCYRLVAGCLICWPWRMGSVLCCAWRQSIIFGWTVRVVLWCVVTGWGEEPLRGIVERKGAAVISLNISF